MRYVCHSVNLADLFSCSFKIAVPRPLELSFMAIKLKRLKTLAQKESSKSYSSVKDPVA